jgi:four helix bundle protein
MLSFQRLDVYQRSIQFLALCAEVGHSAPRGHAQLLDQLKRAATSVTLNIAEAAGRTSRDDACRIYAIARGSAMECAATIDTLLVLSAMDPAHHDRGIQLLHAIVSMLTVLCR